MKSLLDTIAQIEARPKSAYPLLMTHVVLGYPSAQESIDIVKVMADAGAGLIELQIPFSDPMADGPTIMSANEAALAGGIKVKDCMLIAEKLARAVDVPLLFMSYCNIVFRYPGGIKGFAKASASAGIQGCIVPDIPPEEVDEGYWTESVAAGVLPIPVVAPVSSDARLRTLAKVCPKSFVYAVSTTGTTGARQALPEDTKPYVNRVSKIFKRPVALGFGISSPEQVKALRGVADIAIVGSAMIDKLKFGNAKDRLKAVRAFTAALAGRTAR